MKRWRCWQCKAERQLNDFPSPCANCGCRVVETLPKKWPVVCGVVGVVWLCLMVGLVATSMATTRHTNAVVLPAPKNIHVPSNPTQGYSVVTAAWDAVPGASLYQIWLGGVPTSIQDARNGPAAYFGARIGVRTRVNVRASDGTYNLATHDFVWGPTGVASYFTPAQCAN